MPESDLEERARKYAQLSGIELDFARPLGSGTDGKVWKSNKNTAVKVLERLVGYFNERDSYLRLAQFGWTEKFDGFWLPQLLGYNDDLWTIEMEIVAAKPYLLDFAKVRSDRPPDFSAEVIEAENKQGQELFEHHWPEVRQLLAGLETLGIYYLDPKPANIAFPDLP